ncbi:DUF5627 domain-containing protein [Paracnuella aquatica]|uniref:DUF5627 domain-containing protein n=1 Tax=Paracnuella aquatica TaxID=2268757 RepID=UPI00138FAAE6|nr:DUF5627 domain-containing protein [Paracnuella aquatica]
MKRVYLIGALMMVLLAACNKENEFPNYKYSTVYFPYQSPIRTIVLGEDIFDNTLDNQRKFMIMASMGGVYENKKDVTLSVELDNSLAQRLRFDPNNGGGEVVPMPSNYYVLPNEMKIKIPAGKVIGGLEVQLTDAFFADPRSVKNTFVIPLRITGVEGADSVLRGTSAKAGADPRLAGDWSVAPKDYVLYAVKYINPYHGAYLRRGVTEVKGEGGNTSLDTTVRYRNEFIERDQVVNLFTRSLTQDTISLNSKNKGNVNAPFQAFLNFDNNGKITVTGPANATYTVTGSGQLTPKGDMWGNEKRDVLHLKYSVNFGATVHNLTDTLVIRDRGVKFETFAPVVNP